jgi:hypothetical protein
LPYGLTLSTHGRGGPQTARHARSPV